MSGDALRVAREVFRAGALERRRLAAEATDLAGERDALALAAVDAMATIADSLDSQRASLPGTASTLLDSALAAGRETLRAAGIREDGAEGEPVDPLRHRIVRSEGDGAARRVARVITPGVCLHGRRLRKAEVVERREG